MRALRGPVWATILLLSVVLFPPEGRADPPNDSAIDIQLFEYAVGPKSFLTVSDGSVTGKDAFTFDALVTFLTNPFSIYNVNHADDSIIDERTNVVDSMLAGEISGAYGLMDRLQIGASLPMVLSMSGDGLDPATAGGSTDGLQVSGLGDLRLEAKYLVKQTQALRLAALGGLTVPTSIGSGGSAYLGDDLPSVRARFAAQWTDVSGKFTVGANAGVIFRKPREIYSSTVGQQITYGGAVAFNVNPRVALIGETFGRTAMTALNLDNSPLEVNGAIRVKATSAIAVLAGGGAGLVHGIGSPGLRVFVSLGWAPDYGDSDNDGVVNARDKCPLLAEDRDGFEDGDGCPDLDNDGDKRPDDEDACPDKREDFDGFEDDDGCPDLDNDKDGIPDLEDRCPLDPEDGQPPHDKDGCPASKRDSDGDGVMDSDDQCPTEAEDADEFEDWDGCPDLDDDKDGIPDESDKCPVCAEDKDGFEDEDGCPDLDNDADGMTDDKDGCPDQAEVINGVKDFDGCPDTGGAELASFDNDAIDLETGVAFSRYDELTRAGGKVADQIAAVMLSHPEVIKWLIVVAAKPERSADKTRRRSERQAATLKARLVRRGVPEAAIDVLGAVSDTAKVGIRARDKVASGEAAVEKVCPERYRAVPREKGAAPVETGPVGDAAFADQPAGTADADADGLADNDDTCPDQAGPAENDGCPDVDTDGDTVVDRLDNCPEEAGSPENGGCKKKQLVAIEAGELRILEKVQFATNRSRIRHASYKLLDNVASVLESHPKIKKVQVIGHTDAQGDDAKNLKLSQDRAAAVVKYLVKKGIAADRLVPIGKGETEPIADNETSKGREENRRVEFKIVKE